MMALLNTQLTVIHKLCCFKCTRLRQTLLCSHGKAHAVNYYSSLFKCTQKSSGPIVKSEITCAEINYRQGKWAAKLKESKINSTYFVKSGWERFAKHQKESLISAFRNIDQHSSNNCRLVKESVRSTSCLQHMHFLHSKGLTLATVHTQRLNFWTSGLGHSHRTFSTVQLKYVPESHTILRNIGSLPYRCCCAVKCVPSHSVNMTLNSVRFYRGQTRRQQQSSDGEKNIEILSARDTEEKDVVSNPERENEDVGQGKEERRDVSHYLPELQERSEDTDNSLVRRKSVNELTLPELSRTAFNIVPYVSRSETLQNLVKLGVDLSRIEKVEGIAELLIKSKFDRDIVPYLKFLSLVGVEAKDIGSIFTKNPKIFKESVEDLEVRIGYFLHKKFTLNDVLSMIIRVPQILLMDPVMLNEKLGFLQTVFNLTGNEVRQVALIFPRILPFRKDIIMDVRFHVKEFIGFTDAEMKQIVLKDPKIFISSKHMLVKVFDYLHNTMLISHQHLLTWPKILRYRLHIIKNRHLFLLYKDRAQYDPCKENFVSLEALGGSSDEEFCRNVAKCTEQEFFDFLKTL